MTAVRRFRVLVSGLLACGIAASPGAPAEAADRGEIERAVRAAVEPLMAQHAIPGMAVAVVEGGERHVVVFGRDAPKGGKPVTPDTLFELGSLSKTFTATLGAYAQANGRLSLSDPAARLRPELGGYPLGQARLLDLVTYTAGGLPLQFPDGVSGKATILRYFQEFRPTMTPGEKRLYSNPSIGLFGDLAGLALGDGFASALTGRLLPALGLTRTFLEVPSGEAARYAFGTSRSGEAIRVNPGPLDAEAYGLKSSAADMARFVEVQIDPSDLEPALRQAVEATQLGRYRVGPMIQGLGWERYPYPVALDRLVEGNSSDMALKPQAVERLDPPQAPTGPALFNKTGSTAGFGAYAAFVPAERIGVVILSNRNWPNEDRVRAAQAILAALR